MVNLYLKKILASSFLILFLNIGFVIFALDVYFNFSTLLVLLIFNVILCVDINIRPISSEKDQYKHPKLSMLLFLALPFFALLPYLEYVTLIQTFLVIWDTIITYISGVSILIIGGIILTYSRLLLGKFGSSKITIEENHFLVTSGIYQYIRHPIYLGMLLVFFGYALSFRSLTISFIFLFFFFFLFKNRMDTEETMLKVKFGKEYELYLRRTKRIVPFIY